VCNHGIVENGQRASSSTGSGGKRRGRDKGAERDEGFTGTTQVSEPKRGRPRGKRAQGPQQQQQQQGRGGVRHGGTGGSRRFVVPWKSGGPTPVSASERNWESESWTFFVEYMLLYRRADAAHSGSDERIGAREGCGDPCQLVVGGISGGIEVR
jgi:hypothetical protein